jgi:hypothetical protein
MFVIVVIVVPIPVHHRRGVLITGAISSLYFFQGMMLFDDSMWCFLFRACPFQTFSFSKVLPNIILDS